jgi:hypothetical protein
MIDIDKILRDQGYGRSALKEALGFLAFMFVFGAAIVAALAIWRMR